MGARQAEGGRLLPADADRELGRPIFASGDGGGAPLELEPLVKGARIPELCDIFLHKAETGPIIISDDKPVDQTRSVPGLGEEKRSRDVECNLSGEPEFFCLNRP